MATEEWKKEVQKHEQYIKDLEEKYKAKCEAMEVTTLLEPRCALVIKNLLRAATLAGYSNFLHQFVSYF